MRPATPTLGYPSRAAAILALHREERTPGEIARMVGVSESTINSTIDYDRRRVRRVAICGELFDSLKPYADARRQKLAPFVAALLQAAVDNGLIDQLLSPRTALRGHRIRKARQRELAPIPASNSKTARRLPSNSMITVPFERRRELLDRATLFLRRRGILVSVADREAQIRRYRVTGVDNTLLLEEVVGLAAHKGMPA